MGDRRLGPCRGPCAAGDNGCVAKTFRNEEAANGAATGSWARVRGLGVAVYRNVKVRLVFGHCCSRAQDD